MSVLTVPVSALLTVPGVATFGTFVVLVAACCVGVSAVGRLLCLVQQVVVFNISGLVGPATSSCYTAGQLKCK